MDYTTSFSDDNGHGTHIAGIIGAKNNTVGTVGIAPDASIYALKALDQQGKGNISDVIEAIDWSISAGIDIINLSLSSSIDSLALHNIVDKAYASGLLIVGSAGNNSSTVLFPAAYESVIAVTSIDQSNQKSIFSPVGNEIELSAPGSSILSTYSNNSYMTMSGTSMAAAYVSGNAALIKEKYPDYTNYQIRDELRRRIIDIGAIGKDNYFGFGLIQAPFEKTVTSITTDKTSYKPGEAITITVKVQTEEKTIYVLGANITLKVETPKGTISSMIGKTDLSGQVSFHLTYSKNLGTYKITSSAVHPQYADSMATASFQISK